MSTQLPPSIFAPELIANGTLSVPDVALRFAADVQVGEPIEPIGKGPATVPVTMRARSANVLNHWFWGRCVHDMEGMTPASAKLPFDYCHDDREALGYSDKQDVSTGELVMSGVLIPFTETDRASEVIHKAQNGFEWQASIYFDPDNTVVEFVPENMTSPVNGGQFEGPGVIFREWPLRGAAVCPYGYDPNTSVQFSKSGEQVAIRFKEPTKMATKPTAVAPNRHQRRAAAALANGAKPKPQTPPAKPTALSKPAQLEANEEELDDKPEEMEDGDPEADTETEPCDCAGEEGCECDEAEEEAVEMDEDKPEGEQSAKFSGRKEAQRFVAAFGAKLGGKWFAEGKLTFAQAQTKFNGLVRDENARLKKKVGELSTQVSALGGEEEPVTFTPADEKPAKSKTKNKFSNLPTGAAKFAASLKLPK